MCLSGPRPLDGFLRYGPGATSWQPKPGQPCEVSLGKEMYLSSTKGNQRIASLACPRWLYCLAAMLHHLATSRCWSTPKHAKSLHPPCPRRPVRDAHPRSPHSTAQLGNHCSSGKEADSRQLAEAAGRDECRDTPIPRIAGSRSSWRSNGNHWAFRNMSLRVVRSSLESASGSGKVISFFFDRRPVPFGGSRCIETYSSTTSRSRPRTRGESIRG